MGIMSIRLTLLACATLLAPLAAHADYLDVITTKLNAGCTLDKYTSVVQEFRGVMTSQKYKYTVEIAVPFVSNDLSVVYWIGREANAAAFGQETDRWNAAIAKPDTPEAKVNAKIAACGVNESRSGSTTF
jgi:hypothetical protein